jgi:hydrogenase-1 operon protein HyaF
MGIESIRVVAVATQPAEASLTGNAVAVLHEVAELLDGLAQRGESGVIDLGGMPLNQADRDWLAGKLGQGEVEMALALDGASEIRETSFHGVWWLLHRNDNGVITGEFIEVNRVPELVLAHADDIRLAADRFNLLIGDL